MPSSAAAAAGSPTAAPLAPAFIAIRPLDVDKDDVDTVVRMWQEGFLEMGPHIYRKAQRSVFGMVAAVAVVGSLWALRWRAPAVAVGGLAILFYLPPAGGALLNALLWRGILAETQRDMTVDKIRHKWQRDGESQFLVAQRDGVLLGCVAVKGHHTLAKERRPGVELQPGEASVWRLSVSPAARGLGLGRLLMTAAERWAREELHAKHMTLVTGNPESKAFYRRIGYEPETLPRARQALFGSDAAPIVAAAPRNWFKDWLLRRRVGSADPTIFLKRL